MKRIIVLMGIIAVFLAASAQEEMEYGTGLVADNEAYDKIPKKPILLTRDYSSLPESFSLKKYCPKAGSQGQFGTCTAWSSTYAARTIAEAIKWGWTNQKIINQEAFAPLFVYAKIKNKADSICRNGIRMDLALEFLKKKGAPKLKNFNVKCADFIPRWVADEAADYTIDDYFTIFSYQCTSASEKINRTKKALSQERPVIINMYFPRSFYRAGDVWEGGTYDGSTLNYHAMCVVAYDDHKEGGAFQIMNSWNETWGNKGFTWVKYRDFAKYVDWAFEIYVKKVRYPEVITKNDTVSVKKEDLTFHNQKTDYIKNIDNAEKETINILSGKMNIELATGENMEHHLVNGKWPVYKTVGAYISGTRYRVNLSNNEPAYVYVIGSDLNNNVSKVFPQNDNISPALVYSSNSIALPDEKWYIEMDNTIGKDYLCVLYAGHELPINDIIRKIKQGAGSFTDKLTKALGQNGLAPQSDIYYAEDKISFVATTKGSVVPIIVEITHN